jgi:hypothetical protein
VWSQSCLVVLVHGNFSVETTLLHIIFHIPVILRFCEIHLQYTCVRTHRMTMMMMMIMMMMMMMMMMLMMMIMRIAMATTTTTTTMTTTMMTMKMMMMMIMTMMTMMEVTKKRIMKMQRIKNSRIKKERILPSRSKRQWSRKVKRGSMARKYGSGKSHRYVKIRMTRTKTWRMKKTKGRR